MKKIMEVRCILVAVDFSSSSSNALRTAAGIAALEQASIHLLHVVDTDHKDFENSLNAGCEKSSKIIKRLGIFAETVHDMHNIECTYSSQNGGVPETIIATANNLLASLIIIGKNGNNGPSNNIAGGQCLRLTEQSRIPLMIVPAGTGAGEIQEVLFPIRPLLSAIGKYDAVRMILRKSRPLVTLLGLHRPADENDVHAIQALTALLKRKFRRDHIPNKIEYYFKDNHFADAVISIIKHRKKKFDLVVITADNIPPGRKNHSAYSKKLINACTVPLLVMRDSGEELLTTEILQQLKAVAV